MVRTVSPKGSERKSEKVAISLPRGVLRAVEAERKATGESRSAFFRRAAEALLRRQREQQDLKQYVQGYLRMPETLDEIAETDALAAEVLKTEPWDEKG